MGDSSSATGEKRAHDTSSEGNENLKVDSDWKTNNNGERSDYVVVADSTGEAMELPTAPDNSLYMTTLQSTYPGATGMKYKNPKTGALRAVAVDATGTKLLPPADGWDDKVFTVITSNSRNDRGSDVSVKRRKIGTSDGESDSDGEGRIGRKRAADARETATVLAEPPAQRRPIDLIVLGVNYKTTDEGFKSYFEAFGTVAFAEIKRTAEGSSKGFGFVQMSTIEEQDKVLATANHMLDGRRCEVRVPDQRQDSHGTPGGSRGAAPPRTLVNKIFVGRLSEKIEEETLRTFFDKEAKQIVESASVTDVFIPRPFRGFAFITFTHSEVADRLCKLNNFVVDGTSVSVTLAVPREEAHQAGAAGFYNDFGYPYGYGKGGAGFGGGGTPTCSPYPGRDVFGYSPPPGVFPRPPYDGWVPPPSTIQGTPRSSRGGGAAHEQPWYRTVR